MALLKNALIGHKETLEMLLEQVRANRLASCMIFAGPSGIGKKQVALALAQELICPNGIACGACSDCLRAEKRQNEKILLIEPETLQIKIEQAQQITQFLNLRSLGRARVVIIDEAHRLNAYAANSLLKILEEPPAGTYFFLISQSPDRLPATIRSRAQAVRFRGLSDLELQKLTGAESWMLKVARGQLAMLTHMKDPEWQTREREALKFFELALKGEGFHLVKDFSADREVTLRGLWIWQSLVRDALILKLGGALTDASLAPERARLAGELATWHEDDLEKLSEFSLRLEEDLQNNTDRALLLENFYFKLGQGAQIGV